MKPESGRKKIPLLWVSALLLVLGGCKMLSPSVSPGTTDNSGNAGIKGKWGIEVVAIRQSAAGRMLDFRYRVTDPEKAKPLLAPKTKAYLIDQASGATLTVPTAPKIGSLRQSDREPTVNRVYFMLFSNPGRMVKPGSRVTVVIGDFKAKDLIVE